MKKTLVVAAAVILMAGGVQAQYGPAAGEWEFTLEGNGFSDSDFDNTVVGANASLGYYYTEALEISLRQGVAISESKGTSLNGITLLALDYHFNLDRWRPFIGVTAGAIYGEDVRNSFAAGPEAGIKYYVKPKTFIQAKMDYQFLFRRGRDIDDRFDDGRFGYSLGIGFNF
jgi:hypothetical protein